MNNILERILNCDLEVSLLGKSLRERMDIKVNELRELDKKNKYTIYYKQHYLINNEKIYLSKLSLEKLRKYITDELLTMKDLSNKVYLKNKEMILCLKSLPQFSNLEDNLYDPTWIISSIISKFIIQNRINQQEIYLYLLQWRLGHSIYKDFHGKTKVLS